MSESRHLYVLVIEDDPGQQRLIQEALTENSHDVRIVAARTGPEALALMQHERPNFILLDLSLPGLDGREVLQTLKRDRRLNYIAIVIFTASDTSSTVTLPFRFSTSTPPMMLRTSMSPYLLVMFCIPARFSIVTFPLRLST